jgi:Bacterial surface proteins containing Ig-like domains
MKNKLSKVISMLLVTLIVLSTSITAFAATVGQQLLSPESGWQRFDRKDTNFVYSGNWNFANPDAVSNTASSVSFLFNGTKLRVYSVGYSDHSTSVTINIDGTSHEFKNTRTSTATDLCLDYEITGLQNTPHNVTITNTATDGSFISFRAIDIDSTGSLLAVNAYQPKNLTVVSVNKDVTLKWDAVAGATGYIVEYGTTPGDHPKSQTVTGATYLDVTNLESGTTYYFIVKAKNGTYVGPSSIEVSATTDSQILKLVLEKNEIKQLSVTDDLADNTEMTWTSSDTSIATVGNDGKVKALKPGDTVITCTSQDGSYTKTINVLVIDLNYQLAVDLTIGDKCRLTVDDLTNTVNVTWTANDSTIATVSSTGRVTAVAEGLTYVTATDDQGNEIGRIYIRVRK